MNITKKLPGFIMVFTPIALFLAIVAKIGLMTTIIRLSLVFIVVVIVLVGIWLMIERRIK